MSWSKNSQVTRPRNVTRTRVKGCKSHGEMEVKVGQLADMGSTFGGQFSAYRETAVERPEVIFIKLSVKDFVVTLCVLGSKIPLIITTTELRRHCYQRGRLRKPVFSLLYLLREENLRIDLDWFQLFWSKKENFMKHWQDSVRGFHLRATQVKTYKYSAHIFHFIFYLFWTQRLFWRVLAHIKTNSPQSCSWGESRDLIHLIREISFVLLFLEVDSPGCFLKWA